MVENKIEIRQIIVDDSSPLLDKKGLFTKEFPSDLRLVNFFTQMIIQKVPDTIKERNLLTKQIAELIKNAIIHGHNEDKSKKVRAYFGFTEERAHVIIEDHGPGFREVDEWNQFNARRCQMQIDQNFDEMEKYMHFKSLYARPQDEGMALLNAINFWTGGMVLNSTKNCFGVLKIYPQKKQYSIQ